MVLEPKRFQKRSIAKLAYYLEKARQYGDPALAFTKAFEVDGKRAPRYKRVDGLEDVPYVCLRIPTGGGKTIVGAYAIRVAAKNYVDRDYPVVLWLIPTNTIRSQTVAALKNTSHPYREALDSDFDGRVVVFDISEIDNIRPQDLTQRLCVVVATLQTLRVEKTEGRQVYAHKEAFEDHFVRLNPLPSGLERINEGPNAGQVKFSFANLMMIHRPLVIMDEAHNARTSLTFDVLKRLAPSCIVELTATPDTSAKTGSNVLYHVGASDLKDEAMIKLPIVLTEHPRGWEDAIQDAVLTLRRLQSIALGEVDFVRPLLLIQAENRNKLANVDTVKKHLIENELMPESHIAVATGDQRELDGINLFDPKCQVEVIITVQALKEGWDCSFAYVFCSVANIGSSKDVEQLLGRVLRMPYARERRASELNSAYAHVSSATFGEAARALHDSLVTGLGFEKAEADEAITVLEPSFLDLPVFSSPALHVISFDTAPDLSGLTDEERQAVVVTTRSDGSCDVQLVGEISEDLAEALHAVASPSKAPHIREQIRQYRETTTQAGAAIEQAERFSVPRLCVLVQGEWELPDQDLFLDAGNWNLLECPPEFSDFSFDESSRTFVLDVEGERVTYKIQDHQQIELLQVGNQWTQQSLVRWLDKQLRQDDIRQEVLMEWINRALNYLVRSSDFELLTLVRGRYFLQRALDERIRRCRQDAANRGFQRTLFGPESVVQTTYEHEFCYDPNEYHPRYRYKGPIRFSKHLFGQPGELDPNEDLEECNCAMAIDGISEVKYWVRNLALKPRTSFSLSTSSDRFYPDFMVFLDDGRRLAVEYKGTMLQSTLDTAEKERVGARWEETSNGTCLFLMVVKRDSAGRDPYAQIKNKIRKDYARM